MKFLETSAMDGLNIEDAFLMIARDIYMKMESGELKTVEGWDGIKSGHPRRPSSALSLDYGSEDYASQSCYCWLSCLHCENFACWEKLINFFVGFLQNDWECKILLCKSIALIISLAIFSYYSQWWFHMSVADRVRFTDTEHV